MMHASGALGAQKAFDGVIFGDEMDALIYMQTGAKRTAGRPILAKSKIATIYTSFCEGRSCSPYRYVNAWVPEQQVLPVVDYVKVKGTKMYILIGSDYSFSRGMLEFTRKHIESTGG
jgi:urea transport system substrate-binding protein